MREIHLMDIPGFWKTAREECSYCYTLCVCQVFVEWRALLRKILLLDQLFSEKANEVKAMAEQGVNMAKEKCKVQ